MKWSKYNLSGSHSIFFVVYNLLKLIISPAIEKINQDD